MIIVFLPQAFISGSKMTRMHFLWNLMRTFNSYQLWLSGRYLLSTTDYTRSVTPQEDQCTLQDQIGVLYVFFLCLLILGQKKHDVMNVT